MNSVEKNKQESTVSNMESWSTLAKKSFGEICMANESCLQENVTQTFAQFKKLAMESHWKSGSRIDEPLQKLDVETLREQERRKREAMVHVDVTSQMELMADFVFCNSALDALKIDIEFLVR
ncbi:hypothetical protein Ddc_17938 [Ditylenchus destructor]|nr:hypothetical protein Ddc_17938 [Ditylenchus destructor]